MANFELSTDHLLQKRRDHIRQYRQLKVERNVIQQVIY